MQTSQRETEYQAMRRYLKQLDAADSGTARNLSRALGCELTARQREIVYLYYVRQMTMRDIARDLGVNVSSVSRTCARGRARLKRCIRYGSVQLLSASLDE